MEQDLSILTPLQKEVYQWKVEQKKSYKGVAEELGLSPMSPGGSICGPAAVCGSGRITIWITRKTMSQWPSPFTRGELEVLLGALHAFEKRLLRPIRRNDTDPYGMLPTPG